MADITAAAKRLFVIADALADDAAIYHKEAWRIMVGKESPIRIAVRLYRDVLTGTSSPHRRRTASDPVTATQTWYQT